MGASTAFISLPADGRVGWDAVYGCFDKPSKQVGCLSDGVDPPS